MKITRGVRKHPRRVSLFILIIPILMQIHWWTLDRFIGDEERWWSTMPTALR